VRRELRFQQRLWFGMISSSFLVIVSKFLVAPLVNRSMKFCN
jgi:hypothetical protein